MKEQNGILENAVSQLESGVKQLEDSMKLQMDSMNKVMEGLSGNDKIKFQGVKTQIESLLLTAKNGGNVEDIVEAIKNIKY